MINPQDRQRISDAIKAVESGCGAEIVTVIARRSDDYLFIPVLWAAFAAMAVPAIAMTLASTLAADQIYLLQLMTFLILVPIVRIEAVTMRLIPAFVKVRRTEAAARSYFMGLQLHASRRRAAVMLYVSEAERSVRILTDVEVAKRIPDSEWTGIVRGFIAQVRSGAVVQGYLEAIERSGALLAPHFPPHREQADELPNHLIVIGE